MVLPCNDASRTDALPNHMPFFLLFFLVAHFLSHPSSIIEFFGSDKD